MRKPFIIIRFVFLCTFSIRGRSRDPTDLFVSVDSFDILSQPHESNFCCMEYFVDEGSPRERYLCHRIYGKSYASHRELFM